MSIEQETLNVENTEGSLDQYGVWVKKQPTEEDLQIDLSEDELDLDSIIAEEIDFNIFNDDIADNIEVNAEDDIDMNFDITNNEKEVDPFDDLDSTLTNDELMNITNEISPETQENDLEIEEFDFPAIEENIDFDNIMNDIEDVGEDFLATSEENIFDDSDNSSSEDLTALFMNDDIEVSIDDFMETEEVKEETLDIDVVYEDNDNFETSESIFEDTNEVEESVDLEEDSIGVEISLDDIQGTDDDTYVYQEEPVKEEVKKQDFNLNLDPDSNNVQKKEEIETETTNTTSVSNEILNKLLSELANLRTEFNSFRNELDDIKNGQVQIEKETNVERSFNEEQKSSGFFGDDDGDDTIALSGDELNNLLTSADFTEENEETANEDTIIEENVIEDTVIEENENVIDEFEIDEDLLAEEIEKSQEDVLPEDFNIEEEVAEDSTFDDFDYLKSVEQQDSMSEETSFDDENIVEEFSESTEEKTETEYVETETEYEENEITDDIIEEDIEMNNITFDSVDDDFIEPSLDNIDYDEEDSTLDEIEIPVIENIVVDPTSASFLDDENKTETDEIDDSAMRYLEGQPEETIADFLPAEIKDEDVIEDYDEPDITSPVNEVFESEQWDEEYKVEETTEPTVENTGMQEEIKSILTYMDRLLENLPEEKITEFAQSEYFDRYKKLFKDLGIS